MSEEKPLDKCTVKELREIANGIEEIQGVSAMKKEELLRAIKEHRGIPLVEAKDKAEETIAGLKRQISRLKEERESMRSRNDRVAVKRLRRKISKLKKRTRKLVRLAA